MPEWLQHLPAHDLRRENLDAMAILVKDILESGDYSLRDAMTTARALLCTNCRRLNAAPDNVRTVAGSMPIGEGDRFVNSVFNCKGRCCWRCQTALPTQLVCQSGDDHESQDRDCEQAQEWWTGAAARESTIWTRYRPMMRFPANN
jgi:hypothetical protein